MGILDDLKSEIGFVADKGLRKFRDLQDYFDVEGSKGVADPDRKSSSYDEKQAALIKQNRPTNPNGSSATINKGLANLIADRNNANALANLNLDGLTAQLNTPATAANAARATANAAAQQQRLQDIAFANAEFGVPTQSRVATNMGQTGLTMGDLPSVALDNPVASTPSTPPGPPGPSDPPGPSGPPPGPPGPPSGPAPVAGVDESIRGLFGELSTQDFTQQIKDLMTEREANLVGLNKQSLDQLAASVALRTTQIGDISKALTESLGTLETDRTGQQAKLMAAVAKRAQEMLTGVETNISDARTDLGPQVTDEFEQVAQLVSGLAKSQSLSSNDAMARLSQVGNMAATERLAAPASLAAESKLALGDQEFNYKNQLQTALKEGLLNIGQEETAAIFNEAMRQEQFNNQRDSDMMQALVNNTLTEDARKYQSTENEIARDFTREQSIFNRETGNISRASSQAFSKSERLASQDYKDSVSLLEQSVSDAAALAEDQGLIAAANFAGIDPITYKAFSAAQRKAATDRAIEKQILRGVGDFASPQGSLARIKEMNPGVKPEWWLIVQEAVGADQQDPNDPNAGAAYIESLEAPDFTSNGISKTDVAAITQLYQNYTNDIQLVLNQAELASQLAAQAASDEAVASGRGASADSVLTRR